jgi:hypothetical protein
VALSKINIHPQGVKILGQWRCSEKSDDSPEGHSKRVKNIPNSGGIAGLSDYSEDDISH